MLIGYLGAKSANKAFPALWIDNVPMWVERYQALIGGFLPALGAAIAGVRATGDFDGFAERSRETRIRPSTLHGAYQRALKRLEFDLTAHTIAQTIRVMEEDLSDWRSLYSRKKLGLS